MFQIDRNNEWFIASYTDDNDYEWDNLSEMIDLEQVFLGLYIRYSKLGIKSIKNHSCVKFFENNELSSDMEDIIDNMIDSINRSDLAELSVYENNEEKNNQKEEFLMVLVNLKNLKNKKTNKILKF